MSDDARSERIAIASRAGDVNKFKPPLTGFRLCCGDFRVFFDHANENVIEITSVRHRREAYSVMPSVMRSTLQKIA